MVDFALATNANPTAVRMANQARDLCAAQTGASVGAQTDVASIQQRWLEGATGKAVIPDSVAQHGADSATRTNEVRSVIDCISNVASANGYPGAALAAIQAHGAYDTAWMNKKLGR